MIQEKIYAIRRLKGYSQEYIACKLNISQKSYSKIERGETKLDWDRIVTIAEILETDPIELVKRDKIYTIHTKTKEKIVPKSQFNQESIYCETLLKEKNKQIELLENQVDLLKKIIQITTQKNL